MIISVELANTRRENLKITYKNGDKIKIFLIKRDLSNLPQKYTEEFYAWCLLNTLSEDN